MTDFGKIDKYSAFVESDPFRNELHYPAVVQQLRSNVKGNLLDVGCGDGCFARKLADMGAKVVGYDIAEKKIEEARKHEADEPRGIRYEVAKPESFVGQHKSDAAISVMVLPYAQSIDDLQTFFEQTYLELLEGGPFISVIFNPDFDSFGNDFKCRRFLREKETGVKVEFLNPQDGQMQFISHLKQFSSEAYELAALNAGFDLLEFKPLFATESSVLNRGENFWKLCHEKQPYSLLIATK